MNPLTTHDIYAILRAADELIAQGGRTLLAKVLKGSREKKVLQLGFDQCPVYGYYRHKKMDEIIQKIDWMIDHDFLEIELSGKLPLIVYTERGWEIEANQRADEFLEEWNCWLKQGIEFPDMAYLKDRNREMIFLFLDKIAETMNKHYIPYLQKWEKVDYTKVKAKIKDTIYKIESDTGPDKDSVTHRKEALQIALKGVSPQDIGLKCWECGNRFLFTVGEQKFYKHKGFVYPKRCPKCRGEHFGIGDGTIWG